MSRKKQHLRIAAIFCLLTFLQSIVLPPMAYALTSGPTAPETTSFEPVDATDMVNLATGSFTYNIPLLEVPGPEGGYPLSLAYHGGIKPLTDASWVGLGWSLNPGAINRIVNGYPDDHNHASRSVVDYWEGGTTETFSVGVSFGIAPGVGLGLDVSISNDTYRGMGGDVGLSLSFNPAAIIAGSNDGSGPLGLSVGVSVGSSGFSASAGASIGVSESLSLGVSASTNFSGHNSLGVSASAAMLSVGASLTSGGIKTSYSVAGFSMNTQNGNFGRISSYGGGFKFGIPLGPSGVWLNLGYRYQRYWMHETDVAITHGVLHAKDSWPDNVSAGYVDPKLDKNSFDSYALREQSNNPIAHPDPDWVWGGSFPSYDGYQVSGQGLSGTIRPYIFENGSLYRKGKMVDPNKRKMGFSLAKQFYKKVNFRFVNDFSNSMTLSSTPTLNASLNWPTASTPTYSVNTAGYDATDQHLAGSRHIEWYTNEEIINNTAKNNGFIDTDNISNRSSFKGDDITDQVGGYSITNESGVTYHYALPAYSYDEYMESKKLDQSAGDSWNKQYNNVPYAYTWLITAMTGPDYVDVNNNGRADEADWGYWITFDYGEWTDNYQWRTPGEDVHKDIKGEVDNYSYGHKQIYYLDAIKSRTHTALFVKDIRYDAKGVVNRDGGFTAKEDIVETVNYCVDHWDQPTGISTYAYAISKFARSSMKLDKIVLLKNKDLTNSINTIRAMNNPYSYTMNMPVTDVVYGGYDCDPCCTEYPITVAHNGNKVIDVADYQSILSSISSKIIKSIDFNTDYSLSPETTNSFNNTNYYSTSPTQTKEGKLTLKSISYKGRNNVTTMPPLNFEYDYENPITATYQLSGTSFYLNNVSTAEAPSWEGEIVKFTYASKDYYLVLNDYIGGVAFKYKVLGMYTPPNHSGSGLVKTKNPPFHKEKFDTWGYYKSDFDGNAGTNPESLTRNPSQISACQTDVWSLRTIETSIGAKIKVEYESKKFDNVVYDKTNRLHIASFNLGNNRISFKENIDVAAFFTVGQPISTVMRSYYYDNDPWEPLGWYGTEYDDVTILEVNSSWIRVSDPDFQNDPYINNVWSGWVDYTGGTLCGDGMRVKSIAVEGAGNSRKTHYEYFNGTIPYVPSNLNPPANLDPDLVGSYYNAIKEVVNIARELPAPNVMYEYVDVMDTYDGEAAPGKNRYHFQVFKKEMVDFNYGNIHYWNPPQSGVSEQTERTITVKNKTSQMGNLLSMEVYNSNPASVGGYHLTASTLNNYTDDEAGESESDYAVYSNQGVVEQSFNEIRRHYSNGGTPYIIKGVISTKKDFPSVLKSTTISDKGKSYTTHYRKYDFYSGQATEVETKNSFGEHFIAKTIPAYTKYPEMGVKAASGAGSRKNMLTQTTASYVYRSDGNGNISGLPFGAEVTTWNDDWKYRNYDSAFNKYIDQTSADPDKVWRQHKNYSWKSDIAPDGRFTAFTDFNWTGTPHANWVSTNEITRYDHFSKAIEEYSIDNTYASAKYGYEESLPIIGANPAKYVEFAFSGAEDKISNIGYFGGEVKSPSSTAISTTYAHTGDYSIRLNNATQYGFNYVADVNATSGTQYASKIDRKEYEARVWIHQSNVSTGHNYLYCNYKNGSGTSVKWIGANISDANTIKVGEWYQLRLPIGFKDPATNSCTNIEIGTWSSSSSNYVYLDDFRFAPIGAEVTCYVYDRVTDQITYILGQEHLYTKFTYDAGGKLLRVYEETNENPTGKRLVSESNYHYKRPF